jgi:hypothetical protein
MGNAAAITSLMRRQFQLVKFGAFELDGRTKAVLASANDHAGGDRALGNDRIRIWISIPCTGYLI